jgi:RimJ/RimL family protein N-acetyltransferase
MGVGILLKLLLTGKRISLRTPTRDDVPILYNLIYGVENPEWKKYDAPYYPLEFCTFEEFSKRMEERMNVTDVPSQMIIEYQDQIIGMVSYYWEDKRTRWLEMGIVIYSPEHWNGGFGTEALSLWIDYLFENLTIERVGLTTWSGNPRMIRCAEKLGMRLEGRMRKCRYYNGEYYDSIRMGILREEWDEFEKNNPLFNSHERTN